MYTYSHLQRHRALSAGLFLVFAQALSAQVGLGLSPMRLEMKLKPAAEQSGVLILSSDSGDRVRVRAEALDFWKHETADPHGTAVERFWIARGLYELPMPPTIRASRSWLRHPEGGARPAMVALVQHVERGPVAIHRTWLTVDGSAKAFFREPRRSLGPVGGGAVRLAPVGETLVVAEGIETAGSVMLTTGLITTE